MKFAYVENNQVKEVFNGGLPQSWKNISGLNLAADDPVFLKSIGFLPIIEIIPSYDGNTQILSEAYYEVQEDEVIETYTVSNFPSGEIERRKTNFMNDVRATRNQLLTECDWTLILDVANAKGQQWVDDWTNYRQQLRDFPSTIDVDVDYTKNISTLNWPSIPNVSSQ
jgi:hypothetical protein